MVANRGLLVVLSNEDIEAQARPQQPNQDVVENELAGHIRRSWQRAHRAKINVENRMLRNLRQRNGEYDPDKLSAIRQQGGAEIYMMLTAVKCRAAKSWIRDVLMPAGDRPWELRPSHEPELSPQDRQQIASQIERDAQEFMAQSQVEILPETMEEVYRRAERMYAEDLKQKAENKAERMAETIEGLMTEGGWMTEFDAVISDLVDFPACFLRGPVVRKSQKLVWGEGGIPEVQGQLRPELERVSPFDIYPAPGSESIDDGPLIERHRFTRTDLYDMIGLPGYDEEAIRSVLREHRDGGLNEWLARTVDDAESRANDDQTSTQESDLIDALEFWGPVPGSVLTEWGMRDIPDPERDVPVCAWLIGRHVIKVMFNPDPLGRKPYSKASFEEVPGSFWGRGVPDLIADCQAVCNAAARAVVNNMGIASGPQVAVDTESLPAGEDVTELFPWKIWQLQFKQGTGGGVHAPIHFYQPNPMVEALLKVYEKFDKMADEHSGIPAYTYGSGDVGGGGRTASGLSMLMNAASKAIKNVVTHLDNGVIVPTVRRYFEWVMQYHPDPQIKGDVEIVARGAMAMVAKEQLQMRRLEFLQHTANPMDSQIVGLEGRRAVLAKIAQDLDMSREDVVPDKEELQNRQANEAAQQTG